MAFSIRGNGGEINVTPLIDVLLVLLVIFLIVMPSGVKFEPVAMPPKHDHVDPQPHLIVKVHADLSVTIVDEDTQTELTAPEMAMGLRSHLRDTHHVVFVEMPEDMPWDHVVSTIDTIHGVAPPATQVALVMEQ